MSIIDLIILVPLGYFAVMGFKNGFVRELLGITGIILSIFLTFSYMNALADILISFNLVEKAYAPFASGVFIFIGTLASVQLAAWLIKKFLEKVYLSTANRILGLAFGTLKSGIIVSAMLILLAGFNVPDEQHRKASISYPYVLQLAPLAYNAIALVYPGSEDFAATIKKTLQEYNPIEEFPDLN